MQFATDTDLADALAAPIVSIRPLLEFDWQKDGTFSTNSYADQSEIVSNVDVDFASIHSDLPSEINTIVGSSSGIATITLRGRENVSGLLATQLWSKYYTPSPLFNYTKEGVPVRYSRLVKTKSGTRTIRQFTGWVSEYLLDEATDTVTLTCSDIYDLQTTLVTLPVWARGPDAYDSNTPGPSGKVASMSCIDVAWVYKNVLQQSGRSLWPMPRTDALAMWPCDGAMLPTVGTLGCALNVPPGGLHAMTVLFEDLVLMPFQTGAPYGLSPISVSGTQNDDLMTCFARSVGSMNVPDRGSSDPARYIGFAGWFKSSGGGGAVGAPTETTIMLGSIGSDSGYLQLLVYPTGAFALNLRESGLSGSSNAGTTRTYSWVSAGNTLPSGWHYLEVWMNFTNSSISAGARIDGTTQVPTGSPISTAAFKYYLTFTFQEQTNQCYIQFHDTSAQHVQIYGGNGTSAAVAGQKDPPYVTAGKPLPARTSFTTNWLTHLPDRANKYGWDILKEAVEGELGVLITREDGSVWMMGREDAYMYGWMPSVLPVPAGNFGQVQNQAVELGLSLSWFSANPDLIPDPAIDLTRAKISGLQYNPSADTFRNAIAYHVNMTKMINAIVWDSSDPKAFYAASGTTDLSRIIGLPSGVVSIYNNTVNIGISATANKQPLDQTSIAAVDAGNTANAAAAGWLASVFWQLGQRQFRFGWGAGILSPGPIYVGSFAGNDQAAFQIGGWKYDSSDPYDEIWYRAVGPGSVGDRGYVLLDLGTNDWRQYPPRMRKIFDGLLRDTVNPVPVMRNLSVPVDPRIQLLDVVKLPASTVVSGTVYAQVVGKRISDTQDSAKDFLDVRAIFGPVEPAYWDVSNWDEASWTL